MADDERVAVKTYVPRHQKAEWEAAADDLDMSQSEFVRTMVQAGRRDFDLEPASGAGGEADPTGEPGGADPGLPGSNPRGRGLEDRVLDVLDSEGVVSWDELVELLSDNFEERVEEAVQSLEDDGLIRFAPREGGYTKRGGE